MKRTTYSQQERETAVEAVLEKLDVGTNEALRRVSAETKISLSTLKSWFYQRNDKREEKSPRGRPRIIPDVLARGIVKLRVECDEQGKNFTRSMLQDFLNGFKDPEKKTQINLDLSVKKDAETVRRALKRLDFVWKRVTKKKPQQKVTESTLDDMHEFYVKLFASKTDTNTIFAMDESGFYDEELQVSGWQLRGKVNNAVVSPNNTRDTLVQTIAFCNKDKCDSFFLDHTEKTRKGKAIKGN